MRACIMNSIALTTVVWCAARGASAAEPWSLSGLASNSLTTVAIPITNPSFEIPVLPQGPLPGHYTSGSAGPGWTATPGAGTWNPDTGNWPTAGAHGTQQLVTLHNPGNIVSQTLSTNLAANTDYALIVAVGSRGADSSPGGSYRIRLNAGATTLVQEIDAIVPPEGTWVDRTLLFSTGASHPELNNPLQIEFFHNGGNNFAIEFDHVQLFASFTAPLTPEPSSIAAWTVGAAVLGLAVALRRRRLATA